MSGQSIVGVLRRPLPQTRLQPRLSNYIQSDRNSIHPGRINRHTKNDYRNPIHRLPRHNWQECTSIYLLTLVILPLIFLRRTTPSTVPSFPPHQIPPLIPSTTQPPSARLSNFLSSSPPLSIYSRPAHARTLRLEQQTPQTRTSRAIWGY